MLVEWYGQSAFRLEADGKTVVIDPFGDVSALASRGIHFDYPAIEGLTADQVRSLIDDGEEVAIVPGEMLFREGEHADDWWVLQQQEWVDTGQFRT